MLLTEEQILNFPVQHFSPSSIRTYLTNRQAFFKRFIRLEYDQTSGPALLEGDLFHKVLEHYYSELKEGRGEEFNLDESLESKIQQFEIDRKFENVNWGAEGSKENSIKVVKKALDFYWLEKPKFDPAQIISIEERFFTDFEDLDGVAMPIPLKSFTDLIIKEDLDLDEFTIEDHKLVTKITTQEMNSPVFEIAACGYWFAVRKRFGFNPKRMIFRQTKKSKNDVGLTVEELEVLIEQNALEFQEISEKNQLIAICLANKISTVDIPEHTVQIVDCGTELIKRILENNQIEFKKSLKKSELVDLCVENGITEEVIPADQEVITNLKVKEIKPLLESLQIPIETRTKRVQMIDLLLEKRLIKLPPQVVPYIVEYTAEMLERFLELYRRIVKELSGQPLIDENTGTIQFLPNPFASFGAEESWLDFCEEVSSGKIWTLEEIKSLRPTRSNAFEEEVDALDL